MNRFAHQDQADDSLRKLEFSDSIFEQERLVAELAQHDTEFSFTKAQRAAFDVLVEEFKVKFDAIFKLKHDDEPGPHIPPFPVD